MIPLAVECQERKRAFCGRRRSPTEHSAAYGVGRRCPIRRISSLTRTEQKFGSLPRSMRGKRIPAPTRIELQVEGGGLGGPLLGAGQPCEAIVKVSAMRKSIT